MIYLPDFFESHDKQAQSLLEFTKNVVKNMSENDRNDIIQQTSIYQKKYQEAKQRMIDLHAQIEFVKQSDDKLELVVSKGNKAIASCDYDKKLMLETLEAIELVLKHNCRDMITEWLLWSSKYIKPK